MSNEIYHEYTPEIVCPYCGAAYSDSWEFEDNEGKIECYDCNKKFNYSTNRSISYSTSKIECQEGKHDYVFELVMEQDIKFQNVNGKYKWVKLDVIKYFQKFTCSLCDDNKYEETTKERYDEFSKSGV